MSASTERIVDVPADLRDGVIAARMATEEIARRVMDENKFWS